MKRKSWKYFKLNFVLTVYPIVCLFLKSPTYKTLFSISFSKHNLQKHKLVIIKENEIKHIIFGPKVVFCIMHMELFLFNLFFINTLLFIIYKLPLKYLIIQFFPINVRLYLE